MRFQMYEDFIGQEQAILQLKNLANRAEPLQCPVLITGPIGSGRSVAARELLKAWTSELSPAMDLGNYQLVMDANAPQGTEDYRYSVRKVIHALSLENPEAQGILLNLGGAGVEVQNALLKSLEEPGPGVRLVLIAEPGAGVLNTIRSRCYEISFLPLAPSELIKLAAREGLEVESKLIEWSGGSMDRLRWLVQESELAAAIEEDNLQSLLSVIQALDPPVRRFYVAELLTVLARNALESPQRLKSVLKALEAQGQGYKPEAVLTMAFLN